MDRPAPEFSARVASIIARLRANQVSYLFVAGHPVEIDYLDWLSQRLPGAAVQVLPDSGHFPQLAHPKRFAGYLAATGRWAAPARRDGAA
jgi:pimeloyl-ACP methyl ester carboxylesterase